MEAGCCGKSKLVRKNFRRRQEVARRGSVHVMSQRSSARIAPLFVLSVVFTTLALGAPSTAAAVGTVKTQLIALDDKDTASIDDQAAVQLVNQLLEQGAPVQWALKDFHVGGQVYPAGTFFLQPPFQTTSGISSDTLVGWMHQEGKQNGVYPIKQSLGIVHVESKPLVLPRIALFYDQTTYDNSLRHYQLFSRMGFKVTLVTANDLLLDPDDPNSVLAQSNVFVMPGGALHLWDFSDQDQPKAIANIQQFVTKGGAYIGVCAGSTEALAQSPWTSLALVDANYHSEWFDYVDPAAGDWDWRGLIGPVNLQVTQPQNPVMFGYGPSAVRAGYGPTPTMSYWGGPAMFNESSSVTVLARYLTPASSSQTTSDKVKDIWGSAAVVTTDYGKGKVVLFGPHPELPGPDGRAQDGRMYAQALYYVASQDRAFSLKRCSGELPKVIAADRVRAITDTVNQAQPLLADILQMATTLVSLEIGGTYHPLGLWYGKNVLVYAQALREQMNELSRDALMFKHEYRRLEELKSSVRHDPQALNLINTSQATIEQFFAFAENLPSEPHVIAETDWTGDGPFQPYPVEKEAKTFPDLLWAFSYVQQEMRDSDLPVATAYQATLAGYDALRAQYLAAPTPANKQTMDESYVAISSSWPAGPMYVGMYTLRHTLDVMEYKVDTHLLNLLTRAQQAEKLLSVSEYALATRYGWRRE
jgi:glutamine amidotransferase-like uncharacterized protein